MCGVLGEWMVARVVGQHNYTYADETLLSIMFCRYTVDIRLFQTKCVIHILISVFSSKYIITYNRYGFLT